MYISYYLNSYLRIYLILFYFKGYNVSDKKLISLFLKYFYPIFQDYKRKFSLHKRIYIKIRFSYNHFVNILLFGIIIASGYIYILVAKENNQG